MQAAMESCPAKTAISGVMGFGLGGMFGLFMSSVSRMKNFERGVLNPYISHVDEVRYAHVIS